MSPYRVVMAVMLSSTIATLSCARPQADMRASGTSADTTGADSTPAPAGDSAVFVLDRGSCFGACPEYRVQVFADGRTTFDGRRHVARTGASAGRIAASAVSSLAATFARRGFATIPSEIEPSAKRCRRFATDMPSVRLEMRVPGLAHQVRYNEGCMDRPAVLDTLAAMVDSVAQTSRWITTASEPKE